MKLNPLTKAFLTVIAFMLAMVGCSSAETQAGSSDAAMVPRHYNSLWMIDHTLSVEAVDGNILYFEDGMPDNRAGNQYDVLLQTTRVAGSLGPLEITVRKI